MIKTLGLKLISGGWKKCTKNYQYPEYTGHKDGGRVRWKCVEYCGMNVLQTTLGWVSYSSRQRGSMYRLVETGQLAAGLQHLYIYIKSSSAHLPSYHFLQNKQDLVGGGWSLQVVGWTVWPHHIVKIHLTDERYFQDVCSQPSDSDKPATSDQKSIPSNIDILRILITINIFRQFVTTVLPDRPSLILESW